MTATVQHVTKKTAQSELAALLLLVVWVWLLKVILKTVLQKIIIALVVDRISEW